MQKNRNMDNYFLFLKSAFSENGVHKNLDDIIGWIKEQNEKVTVNISQIPFAKLKGWGYDEVEGRIKHDSGKFFSIDGIKIETNWGKIAEWEQPIINQPEVGYLGFITKEIGGVLHFLMQAKIEPGNVNYVQLSPTLQATRSNYTQVHKGKKPRYLEYFQNAKPEDILLDQLQSEQGARFLKKRNRNIIIKTNEDIPEYDNFIWLTLAQLKKLMHEDNLVNMDTRTVISGIPFGNFNDSIIDFVNFINISARESINRKLLKSALSTENSIHTIEDIITFITHLKSIYDLNLSRVPLDKVKNWIFGEDAVYHVENKYFRVIAVDVEIGNREVVSWGQPMVQPAQDGLCAFVCKEINGVLHFAVQAKLECGNFDVIELAPTVQSLTGNYRDSKAGVTPFLDYVQNVDKSQIIFDALQSEEGGRFYKEQNRNMIVLAGDEVGEELPENYIWMTLNQLFTFLKFNNYLNIQARSLIAAIAFI